jgi:protein involved in polysaccharide export with SLBB domain
MSIEHVGKGLRLWAAVCGLVFFGFCLAGCRSASPKQEFADLSSGLADTSAIGTAPVAATTPPAATPAPRSAKDSVRTPVSKPAAIPPLTKSAGPEPEVLRVGDSLTITFTDTPLPIPMSEQKIKEDGTITLTLNQTFKADGKTRGELEKEIRARYVPDYFKYMTVTVKLDINTRWYYINGEVKAPARQIYASRITVLKAIASAGGFTDFAKKTKVKLTRVDGRMMTVNCVKALDNPALDPEVYPGDTIHVPRRVW